MDSDLSEKYSRVSQLVVKSTVNRWYPVSNTGSGAKKWLEVRALPAEQKFNVYAGINQLVERYLPSNLLRVQVPLSAQIETVARMVKASDCKSGFYRFKSDSFLKIIFRIGAIR